MANLGGEFSFFQGIHVRIDLRIKMSISLRLLTTKFGKQVHKKMSHDHLIAWSCEIT